TLQFDEVAHAATIQRRCRLRPFGGCPRRGQPPRSSSVQPHFADPAGWSEPASRAPFGLHYSGCQLEQAPIGPDSAAVSTGVTPDWPSHWNQFDDDADCTQVRGGTASPSVAD